MTPQHVTIVNKLQSKLAPDYDFSYSFICNFSAVINVMATLESEVKK